MSIDFECEKCGMPMHAKDRNAGMRGHCKHCGNSVVVPGERRPKRPKKARAAEIPRIEAPPPEQAKAEPAKGSPRRPTPSFALETDESVLGDALAPTARQPPFKEKPDTLKLKDAEHHEPDEFERRLLAPHPSLSVKDATEDPVHRPKMVSDVDGLAAGVAEAHSEKARDRHYKVTDPHRIGEQSSAAGPPHFVVLLPTMIARKIAALLRTFRDWFYLISLLGLFAVGFGYLFEMKAALHVGATVVVASNIAMLCVGVAYLITLPFKESFFLGLANLLIPGYAVYYWWSRWSKMKKPVLKTLGAFLPVGLVGLAYLAYKESPRIEKGLNEGLPKLEKSLEGLNPIPEPKQEVDTEAERKAKPSSKSARLRKSEPTRDASKISF